MFDLLINFFNRRVISGDCFLLALASKVDFIVLLCRSFNNFESNLILQYFNMTTKISPSMYQL